jgi:hypothetical protein
MSNELNTSVSTPQPPPLTVLPGPAPAQTRASKPKTRNGRIARLPKLERDMVNRMLSDAVPHNKIAEALAQRGFKVTPRNVSNWATRGGYHQWRLDQALLVQTRLDQDTLTDLLHEDPTRLPEVGLQIMATRYSQQILHASGLDPKQSLPLVAMLCRINHEILKLHKFRDLRCTIGNPGYQFERQKKDDKKEIEILRKTYSGQPVENETSSPKYTILDLVRAMRKGRADATALWSQLEPAPKHSADAQSTVANPKPPPPASLPRRPRKPKSKTNSPTAPASSPRPSEGIEGSRGPDHPTADRAATAPQIENSSGGEARAPSQVNGLAPSDATSLIEAQNSSIKAGETPTTAQTRNDLCSAN